MCVRFALLCSKKDTVRAGEQCPAGQQLRHDAADRPNVHRLVVVHPVEHNFGRPVPAGRDVAGHLVLGRAGQPKVQYFQLAVLVHGNVGRFQILRRDREGEQKRKSVRNISLDMLTAGHN